MAKVRSYTDEALLDRVTTLPTFNGFPKDYWILGVRAKNGNSNEFECKFYLYHNTTFIIATSGTTVPGITALKGFEKYNKHGAAVIKSDMWYHNVWKFGYHKRLMKALKQVRNMHFYRDGNKNTIAEEKGSVYIDRVGLEFHTVSYNKFTNFIKKYIFGWSAGCQVANNVDDYYEIIDRVRDQKSVTYCLLKEF